MKYKVSLLPEKNRKRINSKKKAEKVKFISLIALCMMLVLLLVSVSLKFYADGVLAEEKEKNIDYERMVAELAEYRTINQTLQTKVALIESIQVDEPSLYNFVAAVANIDHPDVSVETIQCADWKASRTCTISGTTHTQEALLLYVEDLNEIEGANASIQMQTHSRVDGVTTYQFSIVVSCSGGKTPSAATSTDTAQ